VGKHFETVTICHALIAFSSKVLALAWVFKYGEIAIIEPGLVTRQFLRRAVAEILNFLPNLPPRLVAGGRIALRSSGGGGGTGAAGVEGEEVFGGAVEFHAAAGGFGDFLAEADGVEADWSSGVRSWR